MAKLSIKNSSLSTGKRNVRKKKDPFGGLLASGSMLTGQSSLNKQLSINFRNILWQNRLRSGSDCCGVKRHLFNLKKGIHSCTSFIHLSEQFLNFMMTHSLTASLTFLIVLHQKIRCIDRTFHLLANCDKMVVIALQLIREFNDSLINSLGHNVPCLGFLIEKITKLC